MVLPPRSEPSIEVEWLEACVGKQRLAQSILWPLTVVYIIAGVTGTAGNTLVCFVIARWGRDWI